MKYVVAGGLGFIGSEICRQLLAYPKTEKVFIIDDNSKGYGTSNLEDVWSDPRILWIQHDLSKHNSYRNLFIDVDHIIICASKIGGIGYFNKIPATILDQNNLILSTIFNEVKSLEPKLRPHITYLSSSMVFESATEFPSKESDLSKTIIPISSYGFSKLAGEFYCKSYAQEFGVRYTIVRPFNAVGPEKPDPNFVGFSHVLPDLVCKIKLKNQGTKENPLEILGDGTQVRHYTDVREVASGTLVAAHHPHAINQDFNIAIHKGHSVKEVAELIWKVLGNGEELNIVSQTPFNCDVQYRSPDISKAKNILGWEAKIKLEDNIEEIVRSVEALLPK